MERVILAHKSWQYDPLEAHQDDYGDLPGRHQPRRYQRRRLPIQRVLAVLGLVALVLTAVLISHQKLNSRGSRQQNNKPRCEKLGVRQEWRFLNHQEQEAYIIAVKCLMSQPSIFDSKTSRYDDFIFAHSKTGSYSHYAAAFLPWHRMYIHIYEQNLRDKCSYTGPMPYWDWTLDAHDISSSPVWSNDHGFGGDGDSTSPEILHHGQCVLDGPFANSTRAWSAISEGHSHDVGYNPHCLSRGFVNNDPETPREDIKLLQHLISPEYVQETLNQSDYESFFKMFESGAHNAIPQFVRGDFLTFSAPNDPVFFLHHAQVDRLWWLWQQRDPTMRLAQFHGPAEDFRHHEHGASSSTLLDMMPIGGLAEDMPVQDVMDTQNGILCYVY